MGLGFVKWLKGSGCEKLVDRTKNEIKISAAGENVFSFKFSNKVKQLVESTRVAVALDDQQYLICTAIKDEEDKKLVGDLKRIRIMSVMGLTQLRTLLSSVEEVPSDDVKKELTKWIRYMNKLNKESMEALKPGPKLIPKGKSKQTLDEIRKYQGLDKDELDNAIKSF